MGINLPNMEKTPKQSNIMNTATTASPMRNCQSSKNLNQDIKEHLLLEGTLI